MPDVALEWGDDFKLSPTGGLALVDGVPLSSQRIVRRLCTAVRSYIWHLEYGAGLPQKIGQPTNRMRVLSIIRAHIALESTVAKSPPPTISVNPDAVNFGAYLIQITYISAVDGTQQVLSFGV